MGNVEPDYPKLLNCGERDPTSLVEWELCRTDVFYCVLITILTGFSTVKQTVSVNIDWCQL